LRGGEKPVYNSGRRGKKTSGKYYWKLGRNTSGRAAKRRKKVGENNLVVFIAGGGNKPDKGLLRQEK